MLGCNSDEEILGSPAPRQADAAAPPRSRSTSPAWSRASSWPRTPTPRSGPPDGETLDIAYSITPLRAEGAHVGAVLVLRDVTERRAFQDELTRRALHDELTGLPNRRLLLERLDHALARSSSTGLNHGLLFLDLDRFKLVNDSYGHLIGDKLLIQVGRRLESALAPGDSVARMSGDEFIVLVEDVTEMQAVTDVAERLLQMLQEPFQVDGHHIFMSASIGVGLTQVDQGRDDVLAAIDAATYAAKAAGRNCYTRLDRRLRRRGPRPPRPRGQPAARPRRGRARAALPADRHRRGRRGRRRRGARALALAPARRALAAAVRARSPRRPA